MMELKYIIFDMDGVIFDTERMYLECCKPAAEKLGLEDIETVSMKCIGFTREATYNLLREHYGQDAPIDAFNEETRNEFLRRYHSEGMPVKKGARELLAWINENKIPVALASSTGTEIVKTELEQERLKQFFHVIVGGDMVSRSKPAPDIFLKAAELLSADPKECVVIEDSFNGVRAAWAAGMNVIMVPDLLQPDDEIRSLANEVKGSLLEVLDYFQGLLDTKA